MSTKEFDEASRIVDKEMEQINAMLVIAKVKNLQCEVIYTYTDLIRAGDSVSDACGQAIMEWIK